MIQTHVFNEALSREVYETCKNDIEMKECYVNIFNTIQYYSDKYRSKEWRIAYGYLPSIRNYYVRHCFIVNDKGEAIDPTIFTNTNRTIDRPYMSFSIFPDISQYILAVERNDMVPSLSWYFDKEVMLEAHKWAEENGYLLMG